LRVEPLEDRLLLDGAAALVLLPLARWGPFHAAPPAAPDGGKAPAGTVQASGDTPGSRSAETRAVSPVSVHHFAPPAADRTALTPLSDSPQDGTLSTLPPPGLVSKGDRFIPTADSRALFIEMLKEEGRWPMHPPGGAFEGTPWRLRDLQGPLPVDQAGTEGESTATEDDPPARRSDLRPGEELLIASTHLAGTAGQAACLSLPAASDARPGAPLPVVPGAPSGGPGAQGPIPPSLTAVRGAELATLPLAVPVAGADVHLTASGSAAPGERAGAAVDASAEREEVAIPESTAELASLELPPAQEAGLLGGLPFALDALDRSLRALTAELPSGPDAAFLSWPVACTGLLAAAVALVLAARQPPAPAPLPGEDDLP
jgi:hypothetical protein